MYLEAVSVCVNYSDYLVNCLANKEQLDRWVIVTVKEDEKTIKLCEDNNIEYVLTDKLYQKKAKFAKGRAINDGFSILDKTDWLAHIDSDILLDKDFRKKIENQELQEQCLYSTKGRYMIEKKEDLNKSKKQLNYFIMKNLQFKEVYFLGFLQLFHSSVFNGYPEDSSTCQKDDITFRDQFTKYNKRFLDIDLYHFGYPCVNWYGRQTPEF